MTIPSIDYIANSVSSYELLPIYKELYNQHKDSTAYSLIYVDIELHSSERIPKAEIYRPYQGYGIGSYWMLRQIVIRFLYFNNIDFRDGQWLSQVIDLPIKQQLLADKSVINPPKTF